MTGPHDSVIGVTSELAIRRMRTGMPVRFETATGGVRLEGALVTCDPATGRASAIEPVRVPWPASVSTTQQGDERRAAREDEPRRERVELPHELPVERREPERGERAGERQQPERRTAPRAPDERDEEEQPDEELRREHLAERDERDDRRGGVADEALGRRRAASERDPDEDDARSPGRPPGATASASAAPPVRFCEPEPDAHSSEIPSAWCSASRMPGAEALDLERPPELAPERVEHAVGPDDEEREVDERRPVPLPARPSRARARRPPRR